MKKLIYKIKDYWAILLFMIFIFSGLLWFVAIVIPFCMVYISILYLIDKFKRR